MSALEHDHSLSENTESGKIWNRMQNLIYSFLFIRKRQKYFDICSFYLIYFLTYRDLPDDNNNLNSDNFWV